MHMKDLKVLLLEDNVYKRIDIKNALSLYGIKNVVCVDYMKAGLEAVEKSMAEEPFELIISDMHYAIERIGGPVPDAGEQLIQKLQEEGIDIPIIICSSVPYNIPGILGTVWYDERRDLNRDLKELLDKMS